MPNAEATLPFQLDTDAFKKAWAEYVEYRKERRLPRLLSRSVQKQWDKLADIGPGAAISAIDETISNGWAGIFPRCATEPGGRPRPDGAASLGALQMHLKTINEKISDIVFPGGCAFRVEPKGEKRAEYDRLLAQRDTITRKIDGFFTT